MAIQRCCSCTSDRNVYRELWTYVKVTRPIERWHVPFNASIEHAVRDVSFLRLLRSVTKDVIITIQPSISEAPSFDCHRATTLIFTLRSSPLQPLGSTKPSAQATTESIVADRHRREREKNAVGSFEASNTWIGITRAWICNDASAADARKSNCASCLEWCWMSRRNAIRRDATRRDATRLISAPRCSNRRASPCQNWHSPRFTPDTTPEIRTCSLHVIRCNYRMNRISFHERVACPLRVNINSEQADLPSCESSIIVTFYRAIFIEIKCRATT